MIYLGDNKIGKIYLGDTEIGKVYLGDSLVFQKGGGPTPPPAPANLAGAMNTWYYKKGSTNSVSTYDPNGYGLLKCATSTDVNNWAVYAFDRATTLWSAVNGQTIKVRIKTNTITDCAFGMGIYQSSSTSSLLSSVSKRAGLPDLVLAEDGYYEQTFVCDISDFTVGSLSPGENATFGIYAYSRSTTVNAQIFDAQIYLIS